MHVPLIILGVYQRRAISVPSTISWWPARRIAALIPILAITLEQDHSVSHLTILSPMDMGGGSSPITRPGLFQPIRSMPGKLFIGSGTTAQWTVFIRRMAGARWNTMMAQT